jgi:hypothetical protein
VCGLTRREWDDLGTVGGTLGHRFCTHWRQ